MRYLLPSTLQYISARQAPLLAPLINFPIITDLSNTRAYSADNTDGSPKVTLNLREPSPFVAIYILPEPLCVCSSYYLYFDTHLHHPIIPCLMMRCIYAIFTVPLTVVYIGQTGATSRTLNQLPHNHRFLKHASLANTTDLHWQILLLLSPKFTTSTPA